MTRDRRQGATGCRHGHITALLLRCGDGDVDALSQLLTLFYPYAAAEAATTVPPDAVDATTARGFVHLWMQARSFRAGEDRAVPWVTARLTEGMTTRVSPSDVSSRA
jgi:hypothetical protein